MNTNKEATGSAWKSRRLFAALAVLAVAFVVLAAVPAVATDSDADTPSFSEGAIAAGYASTAEQAVSTINSIGGFSLTTGNVADSTAYLIFHFDAEKYNSVSYSRAVDGTAVSNDADSKAQTKDSGTFGANTAYFMFTVQKDVDLKNNQDAIAEAWSAEKTYTLTVTLTGPSNASKTITADVKGEGVTLYQNITADLTVTGTMTLDLNGQTLTNSSADTITVQKDAKLTVVDSSEKKTGTVDNITNGKAAVYNNGTVALDAGKYTRSTEASGNSYYVILNHGTMTIGEGVQVIRDGSGSSLVANGYYGGSGERLTYVQGTNQEKPELTINGGTFTDGLNTLKNDDNGVLTVEDGTFTCTNQVALQNHNVATINGGTFTSTIQAAVQNCGCATNSDIGTLTINGGTFKGADGYGQIWDDSPVSSTVTIGKNVSISVLNDDMSVKNSAKVYDATKATMILSEGSSVQFIAGSLLPSKITYSASTTDVSTASFTSVKAGAAGVTISAGSIEINGQLVQASANGTITVTGDAVVTGNSTIDSGVTLTIADDASLTVQEGVTLTVNGKISTSTDSSAKQNGKLVVNGTLKNDSGTVGEAVAVTVGENGSVSNSDAISNIAYDADSMKTATISEGDELENATYGAAQRVEVKGNATVTGTLTIKGVLHVNAGVTLTIASTGKVIIEGAGTSIIEGILVLEEGDDDTVTTDDASLTVQGNAVLQIVGSLSVAGDLTVTGDASIQFMSGSNTTVGGSFSAKKAVVEDSASLTIDGAISGDSTTFEVAGTLTIESTETSADFTVKLTAKGAILDIQSVAMANNGKITVQDKGTVTVTSGKEADPDYIKSVVTVTLNSAVGYTIASGATDDGSKISATAVLSGLKVTDSMKPSDDKKSNIYSMQLSGTVAVDQDITYTGIGSVAGYTEAAIAVAAGTTVQVADALTLGAGISLSNLGTLEVSAAVDATAYSTVTYLSTSSATNALDGSWTGFTATTLVLPSASSSSTSTGTTTKYVSGTTTQYARVFNGSNASIVLSDSGSVTTYSYGVVSTDATPAELTSKNFAGAAYTTGAKTSTTDVTYHYVTIDAALSALNAGTTDAVTLYGKQTITADATILSKDTVTLATGAELLIGAEAGDDVTLTVADGGNLKVTDSTKVIKVNGTLTAEVYKQVAAIKSNIDSDVYTQTMNAKGQADNNAPATWTNIKAALDGATSGQTVKVNENSSGVSISKDVTIKEGVVLDANGRTITVAAGKTLTVTGTLDLSTSSASKLVLASKTGTGSNAKTTYGAVAYTDGLIAYTASDIASQVTTNGGQYLSGAYYDVTTKGTTVHYLASYTTGIANILTADKQSVTLDSNDAKDSSNSAIGVVLGDVSVTGASDKKAVVTIADGDSLTAGTVTLSYASIVVPASVEVAATVADAAGSISVAANTGTDGLTVADAAVGSANVLTVVGYLDDIDTTKSADSSVTVTGSVYVVGALTIGTDKAAVSGDLVVYGTPATTSSGSTTAVTASVTTLAVDGSVSVQNGSALNGTTMTISAGASVAVPNGSLVYTTATVLGSLDATADNSVSSATSSATVATLYVGLSKKTTAADAALTGSVALATGTASYAVVAASGSVPEAWTTGTGAYKATTYTVDGNLYVTVYANTSNQVKIVDPVDDPTVTNAKFVGWYVDPSKETTAVGTHTVGETGYTAVVAKIKTDIYSVKIQTDGGVNYVTIDGVLLTKNATDNTFSTKTNLVAGAHTVVISAVSGYDISKVVLYSGTGAELGAFTDNSKEITLSGNPTGTNDTVTVSYSLIGSTAATNTGGSSSSTDVSGIIDAINKNTDAVKNQDKNITVNSSSDDDNDLTNILLVVLVILIIVMAILVAMRMMRS